MIDYLVDERNLMEIVVIKEVLKIGKRYERRELFFR